MKQKSFRRPGAAIAAATILTLGLASCAPSSEPNEPAEPAGEAAIDAALEEGGELLVWGWEGTIEAVVDGFREEYPRNVDMSW